MLSINNSFLCLLNFFLMTLPWWPYLCRCRCWMVNHNWKKEFSFALLTFLWAVLSQLFLGLPDPIFDLHYSCQLPFPNYTLNWGNGAWKHFAIFWSSSVFWVSIIFSFRVLGNCFEEPKAADCWDQIRIRVWVLKKLWNLAFCKEDCKQAMTLTG